MKKGLTLIELISTVIMFAILLGVAAYVFRAVLISWSGQETRAGVYITLDRTMEEITRDLREAREVQSTAGRDEIRFSQDQTTYYIYYLYNEDDAYVPPPVFDEDSYELRKATLVGDINGTFVYGDGRLIISDVVPPATSDLSYDGTIITVDLSVTRDDETIRTRTEIKPRNL